MKKFILLYFITICLIFSSQVHASSVNVALGASVTASHGNASGTKPGNITDGNWVTGSQIYSTTTNGWWKIDLGSPTQVDWIRFFAVGKNPNNGINYTLKKYSISYKLSEDDTWNEIVYYSGGLETGFPYYMHEHYLDTPVVGQYFLVRALLSNYTDPFLREIELYKEISDTTIPEPASILLLLTGVSGVTLSWRKRR